MQTNDLRALYSEAAQSSRKAKELYEYLSQTDIKDNALLLAYFAAAEALKAKDSLILFTKMAYLQTSKQNFAKAIRLEPKNPEIRFLRFSIEYSLPFFLGMSTNLTEDKKIIITNLEQADIPEGLRQAIADFLLKSGKCLSKEKTFLNNFLE